MTDTQHFNRTRDGVSANDRNAQARAAVKAFRAMQFGLTSYARAITGDKKVSVELATGTPRTDGKKIYYQPPIALGDPTPHDRRLCEKRDEVIRLMLCPACAIREEVLVNIYHEIGHIAFGSFAKTTDHDRRRALDEAIKEWGGQYADRIRQRIEQAPYHVVSSYQGLSHLISPYLPYLVNCIEDARVDSAMFRARKGVRTMMQGSTYQIFTEAFETREGPKTWKDAPLNSQASVACYLVACGYEGWEEWLHPVVVEAIKDPDLAGMLAGVADMKSASETYNLSFPVLARLRELGFFLTQQERDERQQQEEEQNQGDDESDDTDENNDEQENDERGDEDSEELEDSDDEAGEDEDAGSSESSDEASEEGGDSAGDGDPGGDSEDSEAADGEPGDGADEAGEPSDDAESEPGEAGDGGEPAGEPSDEAGEEVDEPGEEGTSGGDPVPGEPGDEGEGSEGGDGRDTSDDLGGADSESTDTGEPDEGDADEDSGAGSGDEPGEDSGDTGSGTDEAERADTSDADDGEGSAPAGEPAPGSSEDSGGSDEPDDSASDGEGDLDGAPEDQDAGEGSGSADDSAEGEDASEAGGDASGGPGEVSDSGEVSDEVSDLAGDDSGLTGTGDIEGRPSEGQSEEPSTGDDTSDGEGESASDDPDHGPHSDTSDDTDDDAERIDTGADEGRGGLEVREEPTPEYGKPEDVAAAIETLHPEDVTVTEESPEDGEAMQVAIIQGLYFETSSVKVAGVREHKYNKPLTNDRGERLDHAWEHNRLRRYMDTMDRFQLGIDVDLDVPESILGPALLQTRRVFADNARAKHQRNLKSGRINRKVLGRRAWNDDPRLFAKKRLPGKRSYAVLIGIDVSGSTIGENLALAKRAAWAQAELCSRAGVDFAVYAHSANSQTGRWGRDGSLYLDIYEIKGFSEPWDPATQERLRELGSDSENLDGHTLEYYRKRLDEVDATDKICLYYTDGKMPAANHDEELEILQREIKVCEQKGYALLGVGIRTNSPVRHGLDTVQIDDDNDLKKVVMHLEKRLIR